MTPLTTPEVLRLLEGGNESPLAKWDKQSAMFLATRLLEKMGHRPPFGDRVEIPPEVVTQWLGPIPEGGEFVAEDGVISLVGANIVHRPAIVISTQD